MPPSPPADPVVAAADAVLFGTGSMDAEATGALLVDLVDSLDGAVLVVDAGALPAVGADPSILAGARELLAEVPRVLSI